jgi:hypothetical protein
MMVLTDKLKHWRGVSGEMASNTAPVLEFIGRMLATRLVIFRFAAPIGIAAGPRR